MKNVPEKTLCHMDGFYHNSPVTLLDISDTANLIQRNQSFFLFHQFEKKWEKLLFCFHRTCAMEKASQNCQGHKTKYLIQLIVERPIIFENPSLPTRMLFCFIFFLISHHFNILYKLHYCYYYHYYY